MNKYARTLTEQELRDERYKQLLGGGRQSWDARGEAQLRFMQSMGLQPSSRMLDIGCGPLRAGTHFIRFLDRGCYSGLDFNPSFIDLAQRTIDEQSLRDREPKIALIKNFDVAGRFADNDFGLAFSVLHHGSDEERALFFRNIAAAFRNGASVFATHAIWFEPRWLEGTPLRLTRILNQESGDWFNGGWGDRDRWTIFPILELSVRN